MNEWGHALKVFIFGFSGVFIGLLLLMWAVQLTTLFARIFSNKIRQNKEILK